MRIVFTIGSLSGGGAERVVARLASSLSKQGHDVYILLIAFNKVTYDVDNRVKIRYVDPKINIKGIRYFMRFLKCRMLIQKIDPDVVLSFSAPVNIIILQALKGLNVKIIVSERNNPYVDPEENSVRSKRDRLYHLADGVVFQTEDAQNYFPDDIQKKSAVIINPIDFNLPTPFYGERKKNIVSVARLEPQKNHKLLIDAFADIVELIPDYKLSLYGRGSLETQLKAYVRELGLCDRVEFLGYRTNVLQEIVDSALFVLSSDYEGISNSLLEALALGLPVISTDHPIGGARLLIKSGNNGLLTKVGDKEEMKEAILKVLKDKTLSERFSKESVKVREIASIEQVTKEWLDFVEFIINKV